MRIVRCRLWHHSLLILLLCWYGVAQGGPAPKTTTITTGTDPAAQTIAPGALTTDVNLFTFETDGGSDNISSVTVNLSTNEGIARLAITDATNAELGFTTAPVTGANAIAVTGLTAAPSIQTFKVRVTPLSHAAMPAVPGGAYAITAPVTDWSGGNVHAGTDTNTAALTIDNLSPSGATAVSGIAGGGEVSLDWTTSASSDFSASVMLRWTASAEGSEVPAEGTDYTVGTAIATATVVCVRTGDGAATAVSGIDGAGAGGCSSTPLTSGQDYTYKLFQKDTRGNYDAGVSVGTFTPFVNPVPTTTSIAPASQTLNGAAFTLTVSGTGFTIASEVYFDGSPRTTTYVSATEITAQIPASDLAALGTFAITVVNPTPGGGTSNAQTFSVVAAAPSATTNAATGITDADAFLNGTVSSNGASTAVWFEYGLTTSYGETVAAAESPLGSAATNVPVSAEVAGVNCGTLFH